MDEQTTHVTDLVGIIRTETSAPTNPEIGDFYYDLTRNAFMYWTGNNWIGFAFT